MVFPCRLFRVYSWECNEKVKLQHSEHGTELKSLELCHQFLVAANEMGILREFYAVMGLAGPRPTIVLNSKRI